MNKNKGKKIGVVGNHTTTIDLVTNLISNGYKIECIINMSSDLNGEISGYTNLRTIAKKFKIDIVRPNKYSLTDKEDIRMISKYNLDALLVFGWQRLIPPWLLKSLSLGAFGTHGSWKPLPYGRGRSLGNWALILGKDKLIDNLFKYNEGADCGDIIESLEFSINPMDTIATLHHKDQFACQTLLLKHLPRILSNEIIYRPQSKIKKAVFLPKRTPDDGVIDWNWETQNIYNLIRSVSKPYPGSFTFSKKNKIFIWKAIPFSLFPNFVDRKPGEILASFFDKTFVVKTKDSALLILEYSPLNWEPKIGERLKSGMNLSFEKLKRNKINEI